MERWLSSSNRMPVSPPGESGGRPSSPRARAPPRPLVAAPLRAASGRRGTRRDSPCIRAADACLKGPWQPRLAVQASSVNRRVPSGGGGRASALFCCVFRPDVCRSRRACTPCLRSHHHDSSLPPPSADSHRRAAPPAPVRWRRLQKDRFDVGAPSSPRACAARLRAQPVRRAHARSRCLPLSLWERGEGEVGG